MRFASVDDVVKAFDSAIEKWINTRSDAFVEWGSQHGLGEDNIGSLLEHLHDWIYNDIEPDPKHVERFVKYYVDDVKLEDAMDEYVDSKEVGEFLKGFTGDASQVASMLRHTASQIESNNSRKFAFKRSLALLMALSPHTLKR